MVKIFLGGLLIIICTFLGKKSTSKYLHKLNFYQSLLHFNVYLKQNLKHKRDNLIELLNFNCKNNDFSATLSSLKLNKFCLGEDEKVFLPNYFDTEEKTFLSNYFNSLGKGNIDSEIENLLLYDELINEKVFKIADKSSKYSKMGEKLGFSLGMALFIIIL